VPQGTPWAPTLAAPGRRPALGAELGRPPTRADILHRMDLKSLPDEVKELVRAQLEAGRFQSVDEVVCAALRLLHEREELFASQRDVMRSEIAEGVAAEERGEFRNGAEAIADVRRRIDERLRRGE
jgi:antitoxin ParD1/3/4